MLNKLLTEKYLIENVDDYFYNFGLIKKQYESKRYTLYRYFMTTISVLLLLKFATSTFIFSFKANEMEKYKDLIIYLGDFTLYTSKIRIHFNVVFVAFIIQSLLIQFSHNKLLFSDREFKQFRWMKLFEMLSGKVKPLQVGFLYWDDVIVFAERL